MHFNVKTVDGKLFAVAASGADSIGEVKRSITESSHIPPAMQRLVYGGAVLEDSLSLQECEITDGVTVNLVLRLRGGGPAKKRCSFKSCTSAPLRIVGDCSFCDGHFCAKHRLLEDHKCTGLQDCKQQLHERNALKLQQEQTVASKV
ncbi:ubiquitin-related domain-containing protein [Lipomyces orientalis]|uniref:Ubiquitin-related domain-containing protein n=1 Tax=Lipomyces orientalis TaxID=1233043 RepID=A0ACC3TUI9_9ASCO